MGKILLHIALAEQGWFQYVVGKEYEQWPIEFEFQEYPTKELIKVKLNEVHYRTKEFLSSLVLKDLDRLIFPGVVTVGLVGSYGMSWNMRFTIVESSRSC